MVAIDACNSVLAFQLPPTFNMIQHDGIADDVTGAMYLVSNLVRSNRGVWSWAMRCATNAAFGTTS